MFKVLVIETFFGERKQNFYYLMMPAPSESGFYRDTRSFNAFFNSTRNPKANVTETRQFTWEDEFGIQIRKDSGFRKDIDWDGLKTFAGVGEFFEAIGYDPKARRYASGEAMKSWSNGGYVLRKPRTAIGEGVGS